MAPDTEDESPMDLAEWAADFRAPPAGGASLPPLAPILERAAHDARKERLEWLSQLVSTVFAVGVFLALVVRTRSLLFAALAAVVLPTIFALSGFFLYLRAGLARRAAVSVSEHVGAAIRRNAARYRMARASLGGLVLMVTAFWVWFPIFVVSKIEKFGAEPWRLVTAVTFALLVFGLAFWRVARIVTQARTELESWRSVGASLRDPPA